MGGDAIFVEWWLVGFPVKSAPVKSAPSQIGLKMKVKSAPKNKNIKRINK
jgi:hypothetical protein